MTNIVEIIERGKCDLVYCIHHIAVVEIVAGCRDGTLLTINTYAYFISLCGFGCSNKFFVKSIFGFGSIKKW
jgi:hypothetical protein